jgi:hypothetical protein
MFLNYTVVDASNAAKIALGQVGDVGYFKPRLGTKEDIYDWRDIVEVTDDDLRNSRY